MREENRENKRPLISRERDSRGGKLQKKIVCEWNGEENRVVGNAVDKGEARH